MALTDERLADLNAKVDRIDQKVDALSLEMHAEFRAMMRSMLGGFITLFAAMLGVAATILSQL